MFQSIRTPEELVLLIRENPAVLVFFSTGACGVCKALQPKVEELINKEFPRIRTVYVEINQNPALAAKWNIFMAPTLILFFDGREFIRKGRNLGIDELRREIKRPYSLMC